MVDHSARHKRTLTVQGYEVYDFDEVSYEDELNAPFKMKVKCTLQVPLERALGENPNLRLKDVVLELERQGLSKIRYIGLVENSTHSPADHTVHENTETSIFTLDVVPALALLKNHGDAPTAWHNKTYNEVLMEVLQRGLTVYGREVRDETKAGPPVPLITCSPGEPILKFVQRLMYEAGINGYFDCEGEREVFVLSDDADKLPDAGDQLKDRIKLHGAQGATHISDVACTSLSGPSASVFSGFDPAVSPTQNIAIPGVLDSAMPGQAKMLNWCPGRTSDEGEPEAPYKVLEKASSDRAATRKACITFKTTVTGAVAGRKMALEEPNGEPLDAVITSSSWTSTRDKFEADVKVSNQRSSAGGEVNVKSPAESPPQNYAGLSLARIHSTGPAVDSDNRLWCKIKFVWDESDEEPQTRAPVMQPMAGAYGGTQWVPRAGDVVIVAFLEGSRENPVIIGCQYDAKQSPLHIGPSDTPGHMKSEAKSGSGTQLPSSASWLGWSYSSIAGSRPSSNARTMFAMNVAEGSELMYFGAPRDYRLDVTRNADVWVKGEATRKVDTELTEDVGANYVENVGQDSTTTVGGKYTLTAKEGSINFSGAGGVSTGGGMTSTSGEKMLFNAPEFYVNSPNIGFSSRPSSGGGMGAASAETSFKLKPRAELSAPEAVEITSGDSTMEAKPERVTLDSNVIDLKAGSGTSTKLENGKVVVEAPDGIVLRCGDTEISLTPNGIEISGGKLEIKIRGESTLTSDRIKMEGDSLSIENDETRIAAKRLDISD